MGGLNSRGLEFRSMVGRRVQAARREAGLSQDQLSEQLGFKDRQILSNIETGKREVSAKELLKLMQSLGKDMDFFTDPYKLVGENLFSWRAERHPQFLNEYEEKARMLVAANRRFADLLNESFRPIFPKLNLTKRSSFEEADGVGEALVEEWKLGNAPSEKLSRAAQEHLGVLLLYVDPPDEISGGACYLPEFKTVLINRNQPSYRRNYSLGHELFHLLTWDTMPPDRVEIERVKGKRVPRVESLAESFTAGLLMPTGGLESRWKKREDTEIHEWIMVESEDLGVSGQALYYRLKNLGWLKGVVYEDTLVRHVAEDEEAGRPPLYSKLFVRRLHDVLEKGLASVRQAAELLDCDIEDIEDLLGDYGFKVPFEL